MEVDTKQLQSAVELQHHCSARLAQSVPITETFAGKAVWEGVVHVFDLEGHPKATTAYAWSSPIEGSDLRGVAPSVQETQNSQFCFETRDGKVSCFATLSECEPAQRRAQEETRKCARSN